MTLEANDDYWGEKPAIDQAIIVAIDDPKARADALANGEIDGFDLVGPADIRPSRTRASRSRTATRSTSSTSASTRR